VSEQKKIRKVGRPSLPKGHAKGKIVPMRLNDEDLKVFTKAARASKQSLSEWMRDTLKKATNICPS